MLYFAACTSEMYGIAAASLRGPCAPPLQHECRSDVTQSCVPRLPLLPWFVTSNKEPRRQRSISPIPTLLCRHGPIIVPLARWLLLHLQQHHAHHDHLPQKWSSAHPLRMVLLASKYRSLSSLSRSNLPPTVAHLGLDHHFFPWSDWELGLHGGAG